MRFDVGEKLSATLFLILLAIILPWYLNAALVLCLLIARSTVPSIRPASQVLRRRFRQLSGYFTIVVVLMTLVNGLLMEGGTQWEVPGGFSISSVGLEFGLRTGMRLLVIATSLLLFFGSTTIPRIAQFLQSAGWPVQLVMTLLLTLHFVETLPDRVSMIFTAQEARGAPVRANMFARTKGFFLILSPLVLSAIVESIDRSMALELRGFHRGTKLTFDGETAAPGRMTIVSLAFLVLSFFCILWIILQWFQQ